MAAVIGEVVFVLLPLLLLVVTHGALSSSGSQNAHGSAQGFWLTIVHLPDWSFASMVLFGQSIVKFVSGLVERSRERSGPRVSLVLSVVIVGLALSLVVLELMAVLSNPAPWIVVLQLVLFVVSIVCYLVVGGAGQAMIEDASS